jgi:tripartite-type tricarboxylate transporter receptor subunit TctC
MKKTTPFMRKVVMLLMTISVSAFAQQNTDYPNHPIKLIVPIAPGGGTDIIGRKVAQKLTDLLPQATFVENKAGAGSLIGTEFVAKAPADGYTLLVGGLFNMVMNKALMKNLPYDPAKDFIPLGYISAYAFVLSTRPDLPVNNLADMVKLMKDKPGQFTYGSAGIGTLQHVWASILTDQLGLDLVHVPFKGAPQAYQEMMAGRLDIIFDNISASKSFVQSNRLKGIVVSAEKRSPLFPQLPTINETGLTKFSGESWFGIFAPANTPPQVVLKLRQALAQVNKDPEFIALVEKDGGRVLNISAVEQQAFLLDEINRWVPLVAKSKVKID